MTVGRLLQILGMAEVLLALIIGLVLKGPMRVELIFLIIGVLLFSLGYYIDRRRFR